MATKREVSWIFDGQNDHTKTIPEISEQDLFRAHNIHFLTYSKDNNYLVLPLFILSSLSGETVAVFFLQASRSPSREKVILQGNKDLS
jgi:hypothetical protein